MTVTVAVAFILVCLRVYVRLKIVRIFGVEDSVILLAMVYILALYYVSPFFHSYEKFSDRQALSSLSSSTAC